MEYKLIRSDRRSVGIEVGAEGITVRAPRRLPVKDIEKIIEEKRGWIEKSLIKAEEKKKQTEGIVPLTGSELKELADRALRVIPERVRYYASLMGVEYGRITIRSQRGRWGSCSSAKNLNFNCLLMLTPPEVLDSVVVHELCHIKEMNHSRRFYSEVERMFPEYRACERWLKENGAAILKKHGGDL